MSNLQDNYCYRVRGTFLDISTHSWEKEKERLQNKRSSSVPAIAMVGSKERYYHHACVKNSESRQSDQLADGLGPDGVNKLGCGIAITQQRLCCGEQGTACASVSGLSPEALLFDGKHQGPAQLDGVLSISIVF